MPLLVDEFHRVGIVGPIANIPSVLLTGIIVPVGFTALAVSFLSAAAGHAIARIAGLAVTLLLRGVTWFAGSRFGNFRVPSISIWLLLAFFGALVLLSFAARKQMRRTQWAAGVAVAICATMVFIHPIPARHLSGQLEFTVLDVGQGDSLFLAAPDGHTMLVDGGGGPGLCASGAYKRGSISARRWCPGISGRGD
jgi:competence protein ComEC